MSMTSTDLAHALAVPMDTPGCWGHRCSHLRCPCDSNHCFRCGAAADLVCLWPMPDSGEPGAELWTASLLSALGKAFESLWMEAPNKWWVSLHRTHTDKHGNWWMDQYGGDTPVEALYAAWQEQENAQ